MSIVIEQAPHPAHERLPEELRGRSQRQHGPVVDGVRVRIEEARSGRELPGDHLHPALVAALGEVRDGEQHQLSPAASACALPAAGPSEVLLKYAMTSWRERHAPIRRRQVASSFGV